MSSLFGRIFGCCLRSSPTPEPGGRASPTSSSHGTPRDPPELPVSNRQKVKERLGNIVRSKEGKMVNVADHLPFNLYNRSTPGASTSRLRTESPSPHPSVGTGETATTSRSGSSRRPLIGRLGSSKEPALGVRLVKGRDGNRRGGTGRGRLGRFGEERGIEWVGNHTANSSADLGDPKDIPKVHVSDLEIAPPEIGPLEDADRNHILALSEEIGKQLRNGWDIGDAGPISRGWGD